MINISNTKHANDRILLPDFGLWVHAINLAKELRETAKLIANNQGSGKRQPRKQRRKTRKVSRLTPKQMEASQIVGECKGNFAEAGRRLGRDPKTIRQHWFAACKKLGISAVKTRRRTQRLLKDRRGQVAIAQEDAQRRNR